MVETLASQTNETVEDDTSLLSLLKEEILDDAPFRNETLKTSLYLENESTMLSELYDTKLTERLGSEFGGYIKQFLLMKEFPQGESSCIVSISSKYISFTFADGQRIQYSFEECLKTLDSHAVKNLRYFLLFNQDPRRYKEIPYVGEQIPFEQACIQFLMKKRDIQGVIPQYPKFTYKAGRCVENTREILQYYMGGIPNYGFKENDDATLTLRDVDTVAGNGRKYYTIKPLPDNPDTYEFSTNTDIHMVIEHTQDHWYATVTKGNSTKRLRFLSNPKDNNVHSLYQYSHAKTMMTDPKRFEKEKIPMIIDVQSEPSREKAKILLSTTLYQTFLESGGNTTTFFRQRTNPKPEGYSGYHVAVAQLTPDGQIIVIDPDYTMFSMNINGKTQPKMGTLNDYIDTVMVHKGIKQIEIMRSAYKTL